MQVVWFKKDLRVEDHIPLARAARAGKCLCLFIYEPEIIHSEEFDTSHLNFANQALVELDLRLRELGGRLVFRVGEATEVLQELHHLHAIDALWSHQETGNQLTFARDTRVASWARRNGIRWTEISQDGVVRRLKSRNGWAKKRDAFLSEAIEPVPTSVTWFETSKPGRVLNSDDLGLPRCEKVGLQIGGTSHAQATLRGFLFNRGERYKTEMSSPVTAPKSCSRLSPYLAFGCMSLKSVYAALRERRQELQATSVNCRGAKSWLKSLSSFESRLSWHCHFMQKLEDEPRIEFENLSIVYDGLREEEFRQSFFDAWCSGQTGYPMIDACMRALHRNSWINFRMRAMLVSFASYHLWLHWRPTAVYLARHFLDFEPGIHFSQFQMQSGTTGINTVRIYSPTKQLIDHDPAGQFIKEYLPELSNVPEEFLAEPFKMPRSRQMRIGCVIGKDYPAPIVEHAKAYRQAKERIHQIRKRTDAQIQANEIAQKHGSRKPRRPKRSVNKPASTQKLLF